jgi:hypothetical protein
MVPLASLWLPILVSAVLVFIASAVIHMFLRYHWTDYGRVPNEERVLADLRAAGIPPGDYSIPHAASPQEMKDPAYQERLRQGPLVFMTVSPGSAGMGRQLGLWFVFVLAVSLVSGYVAGRALGPGADYGQVFRFAGTTAFAAYALGIWPMTIWYGRSATTALKTSFDGLVYALLTGGAFGGFWP